MKPSKFLVQWHFIVYVTLSHEISKDEYCFLPKDLNLKISKEVDSINGMPK